MELPRVAILRSSLSLLRLFTFSNIRRRHESGFCLFIPELTLRISFAKDLFGEASLGVLGSCSETALCL
jgi:hypothetical protein